MRFCRDPVCSKQTLRDDMYCRNHGLPPISESDIERLVNDYLDQNFEELKNIKEDVYQMINDMKAEIEDFKQYL